MKVRIEVEVGPTELREFLGLPDVAGIQQEALDVLVKKLRSGAATGSDAIAVLRGMVPEALSSLMPESLTSLSEWQRLIGRALQTGRPVTMETTIETKPPAGKTSRPASKKKKRASRNTGS